MIVNGFVFARGGSVGLPGKNLRLLDGKPLLAWAIDCMKQSSMIERIFVSTDSQEIAYTALRYGADVIERPPHLAQGEQGSEWRAWRHALDHSPPCDVFVSCPATSPLRTPADIDRTIDALGNNDAAVTVTPVILHPFRDLSLRRQDREPIMNTSGVCYAVKPSHIRKHTSLFDGIVQGVPVPKERAVDIDDIHDLHMAEGLLRGVQENNPES